MRLVKTAIVMGILMAAVAGCATNHDSPKRFVGQPISMVMGTMPKYGGYQETDSRGRPYYRWNFTETETVSVQYSTTKQIAGGPLVGGGRAFGNEERLRHCSIRAYYDPATMITTRL